MSNMNHPATTFWRKWERSADEFNSSDITVIDRHLIFIQDGVSAASGKLVRLKHQLCTLGEIRYSDEMGFELNLIDLGFTYTRAVFGGGSAAQSRIEEALFSQGRRIGFKAETEIAVVQNLSLLSIYIDGLLGREDSDRLRREWVEEYNRSTADFRRRLLRTVYRRSIRANSEAGIDTSITFVDCELFKQLQDQDEAITSMVEIILEEDDGHTYSRKQLESVLRSHYLS